MSKDKKMFIWQEGILNESGDRIFFYIDKAKNIGGNVFGYVGDINDRESATVYVVGYLTEIKANSEYCYQWKGCFFDQYRTFSTAELSRKWVGDMAFDWIVETYGNILSLVTD